jgi:hypothetical protein
MTGMDLPLSENDKMCHVFSRGVNLPKAGENFDAPDAGRAQQLGFQPLPDGTIKVLSRHLQISDEAFLKSYYRDVLLAQLDRDLYPDEKGIDLFLNQERATNPAAAKIKPGDHRHEHSR